MEVFRTPEERFNGLPGFDYEPSYEEVDGLRLGRVDVGDGPPVVLMHGEPAWSYVWRKVMPPLLDAGFRCVALDHAGFGRSDKPLDPRWQGLERHVELTNALFERLDLRDATLVLHDWGGPIGFRVAIAQPERVTRVVVLDTTVDAREVWMNDTWVRFRRFIEDTEDLPVGELMRATCIDDLSDDEAAAYEAPYPTDASKAGLRGLAMSVPDADEPDLPATVEALYARVRSDPRPMLMIWGESDLFLTLASGQRLAAKIGRRIDHVIPGAGHGLQEDRGELVGRLIAEWVAR